ncbi:Alpha/Beta hydrolase protein [Pilobolus umbonatus]|nr:Alpha/Beta hydrolase protein [Pilobolus umbonatus]
MFRRSYSQVRTVALSFERFGQSSEKKPLIICHGLFGSKQQWKSIAKVLSDRLDREVYTLDARNHGTSPHRTEHTYDIMSDDLHRFMDDHRIDNPILMGHSMGAKTVMYTANKVPVSKLIVIDMPPIKVTLGPEYNVYIQAMKEIDSRQLTQQKEADQILQKIEPSLMIRQSLLTNLKKDRQTGIYQFRNNYNLSVDQMADYFQSKPCYVTTQFIAGGNSPYCYSFIEYADIIKYRFPHSTLFTIEGAGHWVQADKKDEFIADVIHSIDGI